MSEQLIGLNLQRELGYTTLDGIRKAIGRDDEFKASSWHRSRDRAVNCRADGCKNPLRDDGSDTNFRTRWTPRGEYALSRGSIRNLQQVLIPMVNDRWNS